MEITENLVFSQRAMVRAMYGLCTGYVHNVVFHSPMCSTLKLRAPHHTVRGPSSFFPIPNLPQSPKLRQNSLASATPRVRSVLLAWPCSIPDMEASHHPQPSAVASTWTSCERSALDVAWSNKFFIDSCVASVRGQCKERVDGTDAWVT